MDTCFDFARCEGRPFTVYVYPLEDSVPPSSSYMKILAALRESRHYTADPGQACLLVLALDTLDRDPLSQDFVRNMPARLEKLPTWRGGRNHLVFNLYSGTWPDYAEDLSFDIGQAILAKASMSVENYRPGFDISLPLFHGHHPARGGAPGLATSNRFPVSNKHFLAFKGKRYVHGIGSDTRNSLHHLHNGRDVVMVTTCK
jgi:glucuronyl/N-acetylglucosaminyl transferase EXT1